MAEQKNGLEGYFVTKGSKKLRYGYTTGSCAAAAAKAATWMLLSQKKIEKIDLLTPRGILLHLMPLDVCFDEQQASCAIRKDGGDDPDATDGLLVYAVVSKCGKTKEEYLDVVERLGETDVDMLEINISCPNVKAGGMAFGILPESVRKITESVKRVCGLPLMVKLSPNVSCIADNARAAEDGGADCISLINTLSGMSVDLKGRKPLLANQIGGLSGPCVKPIALRMVWDCVRAVKIPIVGLGGISTAEDALEFMLCGARLVQVGTANLSDPLAMPKIIEGMEEYCAKNGVKNVSELVGGLRD